MGKELTKGKTDDGNHVGPISNQRADQAARFALKDGLMEYFDNYPSSPQKLPATPRIKIK